MRSAYQLLYIGLTITLFAFPLRSAAAQSNWDQVLPRVKQKCAQDYPDDFSMQAFCIKRQHEGWLAVNNDGKPDTVPPSHATQQEPRVTSGEAADVGAEAQFVETVARYKKAYDDAANDMQKGALRPARGRTLCEVVPSTNVQNWRGTVYSLSSNNDGNGAIEIDLGSGVYVKTMNNSFSDSGYHTMIPFGTPLFDQVSQLNKGADIIFSGNLFHDPIDCFKETSLTVQGAMTEPEFVVRVTAVGRQQFSAQTQTQPLTKKDSSDTALSQGETAAFTDGQNARMAYEQWFSGLSEGDYHGGAAFWASHRGDRQPPSCRNGSNDFQAGCMEAARRLAPADIRRRADADFRRGWNSM